MILLYKYIKLQLKDLKTVTKEIMGRAIESAECGMVGKRTIYRNKAGQNLLKDRHNIKEIIKRLEILEDWIAEKDTQIANH